MIHAWLLKSSSKRASRIVKRIRHVSEGQAKFYHDDRHQNLVCYQEIARKLTVYDKEMAKKISFSSFDQSRLCGIEYELRSLRHNLTKEKLDRLLRQCDVFAEANIIQGEPNMLFVFENDDPING